MRLTNVCYALFTITLTATCIKADDRNSQSLSQEHSGEQTKNRENERRIHKREAALIIDSYPSESGFEPKNKVIYRRVTRLPYRTSRPKYGPKRTKPIQSSRPVKQKRSKYNQAPSRYNYKYGPPKSQKKRPPKSKPRGRLPPIHVKPVYSVSKHRLQRQPSTPYRPPEPTGFAEPPNEYVNHNPQSYNRPTFFDPPVDSYGAPLTSPTAGDAYYNQGYPMEDDELGHAHNQVEGFQSWDNDKHNVEPKYAFTKKLPTYVEPDPVEEPHNPTPLDYHDFDTNSHADTYKHETSRPLKVQKHYNRPWTAKKPRDHVIVGGQYAEPPGRYVPKLSRYPPIAYHEAEDEETHFGSMREFDTETSASGTRSSYVNYKNSNMAFSPQNLNDAFSIVD